MSWEVLRVREALVGGVCLVGEEDAVVRIAMLKRPKS